MPSIDGDDGREDIEYADGEAEFEYFGGGDECRPNSAANPGLGLRDHVISTLPLEVMKELARS
jgi:hypothetical protein